MTLINRTFTKYKTGYICTADFDNGKSFTFYLSDCTLAEAKNALKKQLEAGL